MSVVNIASPYNSPSENPKISSRSSKDSGYGSLATLLNRSVPAEQETPEETAPKHVTAVVVSQESRGDVEKDGDSSSGSETEIEEDENVKSGEITLKKEEREASSPEVENSAEVEVEEPEAMEETGPIVGVNHNKLLQLQGQRIKSVPKLSNNRPPNKFKELTFKKKVYSRRLPQVSSDPLILRDIVLSKPSVNKNICLLISSE